jgi:hypothetical protein
MANVIRIKRRLTGNAGAPGSLYGGELAYNEVDGTLFYGKGDDGSGIATDVIAIGGSGLGGEYVTLTTTQTITGEKTFSGQVAFTGEVNFSDAAIEGISLYELDDVNINPETPPSEGDVLTWSDSGQEWIATSVPRDSITSIVATPNTGITVSTVNGVATIAGLDATTSVKGVVRFATALEMDAMTATNVAVSPADMAAFVQGEAYVLEPATTDTLGGIKVGTGLSVTADGTLSTNIAGALVYRGSTDVTQAAPAAVQGDVYVNEVTGEAVASWTGVVGLTIAQNALMLYDGTEWDAIDIAQVAITEIVGIDPIEVNATNQTKPEISVKDATTTQKGVVTLASSQDIIDGTAGKVPTADQIESLFTSINDRLPDGANDGENLSWSAAAGQWISGWLDGGLF